MQRTVLASVVRMRTRALLRFFAIALVPPSAVAVTACTATSAVTAGLDAGTDASDGGVSQDALDGDASATADGDAQPFNGADGDAQPFNGADSSCEYLPAYNDGGAIDAPDATDDGGAYPQSFCVTVCPANFYKCEPDDGGIRCANCFGRRPQGLVDESVLLGDPGFYFAEMARLEAASVVAFRVLARELTALRAPRTLVRAAERAARDEIRHARAAGALARRYGREPVSPRIEAHAPRDLETIARENAVEGCVHETWGALAAHHQAATSRDVVVRAVMRRIAKDETEHAALAWRVARFLEARLDPAARLRVDAARRDAARVLALTVHEPPTALRDIAGLAGASEARNQLATLDRLLWKAAA
jgi:hypothetical protein